MELLDQLPKCLHLELIQASESGKSRDDSRWKTSPSVMLKPRFVSAGWRRP